MGTQPSETPKITTSPPLTPAFDPNISDYVVSSASGSRVQVNVDAAQNTQVGVDDQPQRGSAFTTQVNLTAGQSFSFVVNTAGTPKTYRVRSLPTDFPTWSTERAGTPQAEYYAFGPNIPLSNQGPLRPYIIIADNHGVPIWWYRNKDAPRSALFLANGNVAWSLTNSAEERKLDGTLVRSFTATGASGTAFDFHELQQLPNGDYLLIADIVKGPVDLSAYGGVRNATAIDTLIEEIAPNNSLVWQWSSLEHISPAETDPIWWPLYITAALLAEPFHADPYHMNSVEPDGNGFVVSFRHQDAVYRIDKASGNIVWKLGGTTRAASLRFVGDPYGNFGGQHDARILPDGTLTLHDNGTNLNRAPRAVRYRIDTAAKTATLLEQITDPDVSTSVCCGSARKLPEGNWVMAWGLNPVVTELTPSGARALRLQFKEPYFPYRVEPVSAGKLSREALRAGMNAQFPR